MDEAGASGRFEFAMGGGGVMEVSVDEGLIKDAGPGGEGQDEQLRRFPGECQQEALGDQFGAAQAVGDGETVGAREQGAFDSNLNALGSSADAGTSAPAPA